MWNMRSIDEAKNVIIQSIAFHDMTTAAAKIVPKSCLLYAYKMPKLEFLQKQINKKYRKHANFFPEKYAVTSGFWPVFIS